MDADDSQELLGVVALLAQRLPRLRSLKLSSGAAQSCALLPLVSDVGGGS